MGKGMRWVSKISRRGEEEGKEEEEEGNEEDGNANQEGNDSNEAKYERDKPTVSVNAGGGAK